MALALLDQIRRPLQGLMICAVAWLLLMPWLTGQKAFATSSDRRLPGPIAAVVERVIDGDTLAVRARIWLNQELRINVRIARIDAPELAARCERERELAGRARDFVHDILFAPGLAEPAILLSDIGQDKFGGRVLARVTGDGGQDIAQALIQAGLARHYDDGKRASWCIHS